MKTVIYHSADFDGIFCREIARKFLGDEDVKYIGWNFGDALVPMSKEGTVYILDLSPDCIDWTGVFQKTAMDRVVWIDHHKTSIEKWGCTGLHDKIPGYRIDGVAACRLAWQWFSSAADRENILGNQSKSDFIDRKVTEPLAVRLAGEYDVWDHEKSKGADLAFQCGLRSEKTLDWEALLSSDTFSENRTLGIVADGQIAQRYARYQDDQWMREASFLVKWEGLTFLCLNTVARGSGIFDSKDNPDTGHDALLAYGYRGNLWTVSLYHAKHRTDLDLSKIAAKYGGGGHRGACGFTCKKLPFLE